MIRIRDISLPPDGDMARLVQAAARQLRISPNADQAAGSEAAVRRRAQEKRCTHHLYRRRGGQGPGGQDPQDGPLRQGFSRAGPGLSRSAAAVHSGTAARDRRASARRGCSAALVLSTRGAAPARARARAGREDAARGRAGNSAKTGTLDPECNVQFGEGGAGTFSDGKLNTGAQQRAHRLRSCEQFAGHGAPSADDPLRRQAAHRHGRAGDASCRICARTIISLRRRGALRREAHGARDRGRRA